jgi:hypothetical protein
VSFSTVLTIGEGIPLSVVVGPLNTNVPSGPVLSVSEGETSQVTVTPRNVYDSPGQSVHSSRLLSRSDSEASGEEATALATRDGLAGVDAGAPEPGVADADAAGDEGLWAKLKQERQARTSTTRIWRGFMVLLLYLYEDWAI